MGEYPCWLSFIRQAERYGFDSECEHFAHSSIRKKYYVVLCVRQRLTISMWALYVTIGSPKLALRPSLTQKSRRWIVSRLQLLLLLQPPASLQLQVWRVSRLLLLPVTIWSPTPASNLQLQVWKVTRLLLWRVTRFLLLPVTIWSPTPASNLQLQVCSSLTQKSRKLKSIRFQPPASF